jgi:predicted RNA-binding protein associated with RNAse of E/G family
MLDRKLQARQWYYDVAREVGLSSDGIPYWDDMYLDVVCFSPCEPELIDQDDLDAALEEGVISKEDYEETCREAEALLQSVKDGTNPLIRVGLEQVDAMASGRK